MRSFGRWYSSAAQAQAASQVGAVRSTVLPNNLRVVTVDEQGPLSTIGLFFNAGSRNEVCSGLGVSHVLSRLATTSTFNRSAVRLIHDIENLQNFQIQRGRETTAITVQATRGEALNASNLLLDISRPRCIEYEIRDAAEALAHDTESALSCPSLSLEDEAHSTAFRAYGLGRSLYARKTDFSQEEVIKYLFSNWKADNAVVAALNVDHDQLVSALSKPLFQNAVDGYDVPRTPKASTYFGGESRQFSSERLSFAIGFRGLSQTEGGKDLQKVVVRLLSNKLGKNWRASSFSYSDSGLVTFSSTSSAKEIATLVDSFTTSFKGAKFSASEVEAAKKAVESLSRACRDDPVSRLQSLVVKCGDVKTVTADQVNKAVAQILSSSVTLVSKGNSAHLPPPSYIEAKLK
jgi:predicted Zn-dependent peptidase